MKKMMIGIYALVLVGALFVPKFGNAYFENKYFCNIKNNSIIVSLHQDDGFQNCVMLSRSIDNTIFQVDDNIAKADKFIAKKEDLEYRLGLKSTFQNQKQQLQYVRDELNKNMDKFEQSLFDNIKKVLTYYLVKQRSILSLKINKSVENMSNARMIGNVETFENNIKSFDEMTLEKNIIDQILDSKNFEGMMPFLKYYLKYYMNK